MNHEERAYRAWPILLGLAATGSSVITYGELAGRLGTHARAIRYVLDVIQRYCLAQKLPPLTILVVNAQTGMPGQGFIAWDLDDQEEGFRQVRSFRWSDMENPFGYAALGSTEEELASQLNADPGKAPDIYAMVKVRGVAQSIFRRALMLAYERRCAFCGVSFADVLQAAHLIPWSTCEQSLRMATSNGLLLCATHHRMFDAGMMTMAPDYTVSYADPEEEKWKLSDQDRKISTDLEGRPAFLPRNRAHWPSRECLERHYEAMEWDFADVVI